MKLLYKLDYMKGMTEELWNEASELAPSAGMRDGDELLMAAYEAGHRGEDRVRAFLEGVPSAPPLPLEGEQQQEEESEGAAEPTAPPPMGGMGGVESVSKHMAGSWRKGQPTPHLGRGQAARIVFVPQRVRFRCGPNGATPARLRPG